MTDFIMYDERGVACCGTVAFDYKGYIIKVHRSNLLNDPVDIKILQGFKPVAVAVDLPTIPHAIHHIDRITKEAEAAPERPMDAMMDSAPVVTDLDQFRVMVEEKGILHVILKVNEARFIKPVMAGSTIAFRAYADARCTLPIHHGSYPTIDKVISRYREPSVPQYIKEDRRRDD